MSAIYASASNQIQGLKELYSDDAWVMKDLVYKKNPALALLPKDESPDGFSGKYFPCPMQYGGPAGGRSASFSKAQSNQTPPQLATFFIYRVSNYQLVTITNELLEATKGKAGAFMDEATLAMNSAFQIISNDLSLDIYGDGSGARGSYSSISTGVITLANSADVVNFEVGMPLVSYSVSTNVYTQSTSAAIGYVVGVDRYAGTVTVSATQGGAAGTPTNWSTSFPYLGVDGDVAFGTINATTSFQKVSGFAAWLPKVAPAPGVLFWGQDRSYDSRMCGTRFNGASESIEEALIDGASLCAREGGAPEMAFVNFESYASLEKSLGAKVQYVDVKHDEADIAFKGITVNAPYGPITVIPDRNCTARTAYLLQMDTWKLRSLGRAPHVLTYGMEGLEALRVGNADALEIRIGYYANLSCNAPVWNAVITLSA